MGDDPVKCGRQCPDNMAFRCQLALGHDGPHRAFPGNPDGLSWSDHPRAPHLWITTDAMGWGP